MARPEKTQAMRALESAGIAYEPIYFPESIHDALGVAEHAGLPVEVVYKTLAVEVLEPAGGQWRKPALIVVAADRNLNMKKTALGLGVKRVGMARPAEAERVTGLKVGGISALALLGRGFRVYLDHTASRLDEIVVSAGKRGINLRLRRDDFMRLTAAQWIDASQPLD